MASSCPTKTCGLNKNNSNFKKKNVTSSYVKQKNGELWKNDVNGYHAFIDSDSRQPRLSSLHYTIIKNTSSPITINSTMLPMLLDEQTRNKMNHLHSTLTAHRKLKKYNTIVNKIIKD